MLIYEPTGAVVAAATTSLPEEIGGVRNWDYRYTWLRDAGFTLNALYALGCTAEARAYARWLCATTSGHALPLRVLYGIDGGTGFLEEELDEHEGYRGSRPVRVGNGAEIQLQLDSYGELLDCLTICEVLCEDVMRSEWPHFRRLIDFVAEHWHEPDSGIWEIRDDPRHFVHSKGMAWVALDRGCRLVDTYVEESPRGHGLRLAAGELAVGPYCLGQWVASGMLATYALDPRTARFVAGVLAILTLSNFINVTFSKYRG